MKYDLLNQYTNEELSNSKLLECVICDMGLNDEQSHELPVCLERYMGKGIRLWQSPLQWASFLIWAKGKGIKSYAEMGTRHGGSFAFAMNYFARFNGGSMKRGVTIDLKRYPMVSDNVDPYGEFVLGRTTSSQWQEVLASQTFDLILIDASHRYGDVMEDIEMCIGHTGLLAVHDICNDSVPDVGRAWKKITSFLKGIEFCEQYPETTAQGKSYFGIGVLEIS